MRNTSRKQEVRVGVITVLAVVALVAGIVWGKGFGFGVNNEVLMFRFPNASGIDVGSPVTVNGVRQGSVTSLSTDDDGVIVSALVEATVPLKQDATARIEMGELTGGKRIELIPGASSTPLSSGAMIAGRVAGDPATLLSDVGVITGDAKVLVRRLDSAVGTINLMLNDRVFRESIENTFLNLEKASSAARDLVHSNRAQLNRTISEISSTVTELRGIVGRVGPAVDRTLISADYLATDIRGTVHAADTTIRRADTLISRLDSLVRDIRTEDGVVSMLIYDKQFAEELKATIEAARDLIDHTKKSGVKLRIGF